MPPSERVLAIPLKVYRVMQVKVLELRDRATFIPIIAIKPAPDNEEQRYLLRRGGYAGDRSERCVILLDAQCRGISYDPYNWPEVPRTMRFAHHWIEQNWHEIHDGDVIDVEYLLGETKKIKVSERHEVMD